MSGSPFSLRPRSLVAALRVIQPLVAPAKAGAHNHRLKLFRELPVRLPFSKITAWGYGSRLALRLAGTTAVSFSRRQLVLQIDHPLDRAPRSLRDDGIDRDLLAQVEQALQDVRQRDPLHVRAQIAGLDHFDVGQFG